MHVKMFNVSFMRSNLNMSTELIIQCAHSSKDAYLALSTQCWARQDFIATHGICHVFASFVPTMVMGHVTMQTMS